MKIKCYHKEFNYKIPKIHCQLCKKYIKTGEGLYTIIITWGSSKSVCKECYDMYEIDWRMGDIKQKKKNNNFKPIEIVNKKDFMI